VVALHRFPVKSMGGESLETTEVGPAGIVGDREWAVYGADGKLASAKHTRRFRRMDPVFELVARRPCDGSNDLVVMFPDGQELALGLTGCELDNHAEGDPGGLLSEHFGEAVSVRRESTVPHQDAAPVSIVGTATLRELGRHEGDGRPIDPRHLRVNVVVETDTPFVEETWVGRHVRLGTVVMAVTEPIQRCRMVGVTQVGLAGRPGLLRAISDHHDLCAGVYGSVVTSGVATVGDHVLVIAPTRSGPLGSA
jgi:uncharacterized protein YcbX